MLLRLCMLLIVLPISTCKSTAPDATKLSSGTVTDENIERSVIGDYPVVIAESDSNAPWVIYLHGYGGTGEEFFREKFMTMVRQYPQLKRVNWLFPTGSWFYIETEDFSVWQQTLIPTRKKLKEMLRKLKINPRKLIWAGFSQGAITAADYVLHETEAPLGLILNSGIYYESKDWTRISPNLRGTRFYMTHDPRDETLPFDRAEQLAALLHKHGFVGRLERNNKGHAEVPDFIAKSVLKLIP